MTTMRSLDLKVHIIPKFVSTGMHLISLCELFTYLSSQQNNASQLIRHRRLSLEFLYNYRTLELVI